MNEVMRTTKIIIGCFVGLTIMAAIILLIFYKLRKKNYSNRRELYASADTGGRAELRSNRNEVNLIERQPNNDRAIPKHHLSDATTGSTLAVSPNFESQWLMTSESFTTSQAPMTSQSNGPVIIPPTAVHVLPPPPEELFPRSQNNPSTGISSYSPLVASANCYTTMQKKPTATPNVPSKQLLSSLANSCRQVALGKRSAGYFEGTDGLNKSCQDLKGTYDEYSLSRDSMRLEEADFMNSRRVKCVKHTCIV
uniref:Uncharacterized protein n=1 Tax=Ciona savignyi TaxID=51511 RepID=H2ZCJ1_CIOSA